MSRTLNNITLIGNVGTDPEVRTTGTGRKVANFTLATNREWTDANGKTQSRTDFHRIVVWGGYANVVEQYVRKGSRLYVDGSLEYRSYEDRNGVRQYVSEIQAGKVIMLDGADRRAQAPAFDDVPPPSDEDYIPMDVGA